MENQARRELFGINLLQNVNHLQLSKVSKTVSSHGRSEKKAELEERLEKVKGDAKKANTKSACRATEISTASLYTFYEPLAIILAGDHKQLRPVVLSADREKEH
jgi:hypothetical protein